MPNTTKTMMMKIENILKPDLALIKAVERVKELELRFMAISAKRRNQKNTVQELNSQLDEIVTTVDTDIAKRSCTSLAGRLNEENDLLVAFDVAIDNSRREIALARHRVATLTNEAIRDAALKVEPEAKKNLVTALQGYFECYLAKSGVHSVGGAQHALEVLAQDQSMMRGVEQKVHSFQRTLYESAAA